MTPLQQYAVIETYPEAELRRVARCTVAEVAQRGTAERVGNKAFGPLVRYISAKQLAMTAPVLQQPGEAGSSEWVVGFVLPGSHGIDEYPLPDDAKVTLREVPEHLALAARWSGRWDYAGVERRIALLQDVIAREHLEQAGPPVWARYDPPWKPWFLRRNEVLIEVRRSEVTTS